MDHTNYAMTGGVLSMRGLEKGRHAGPKILAASCCFVLLATACSPTDTTTTSPTDTTTTSTSTTDTTQPATGTLIVHGGTVELNGLAVPPGTTVDVQAGDRVRATDDGLATLRQAQLSLELFKGSTLRVPDTTKRPVVVPLESGHLQVSVSPGAAQVQLQTADRTLTVEGTSFVVCQAATGTTCLFVIDGSVDWSDPRGDMTYFAGEGTFATADQGPQAARCDMDDTVEQWLDIALAGEQNGPLTATVDTLSEGSCAEAGIPSAEGMAQVAIADPVIGTENFANNPDNYREPEPIDGPIAFSVDKQAVSNLDFRNWVVAVAQNDPEEWKRLVPNSWLDGFEGVETQATYPSGEDDLAVIGVRWEAGGDYCRDLGKHLVTEIEWELAAVNEYLMDLEAERQDWVAEPGEYGDEPPEGERMKRGNDNTFRAASDVDPSADYSGLIAFLFACYGAGTPQFDDFSGPDRSRPKSLANAPFVGALPKALLGHESGAALAVVGHVDRAWTYSFDWPEVGPQTAIFEDTLFRLFAGYPIGYAMEMFNERHAELAVDLHDSEGLVGTADQLTSDEVAGLWTAKNDSRNYALLGDPAVRLVDA